jgi:hypothetical protein
MKGRFYSLCVFLFFVIVASSSCEKEESDSFKVVSITPSDKQENVNPKDNIIIIFSEGVDLEDHYSGQEIMVRNGYGDIVFTGNIVGTGYDNYHGTKKLTVFAIEDGRKVPFKENTKYWVDLNNLRSVNGNVLKGNSSFGHTTSFTTGHY